MKLLICFSMALAVWVPSLALAQEDSAGLDEVDLKLSRVETKITQLESGLNRIVQKQSEIDRELSSLKMWIRRHRGGS